jgi:hypothetical protein
MIVISNTITTLDSPQKPMQTIFFNELAVLESQIKTAMPKFVWSNLEPFQMFDESTTFESLLFRRFSNSNAFH